MSLQPPRTARHPSGAEITFDHAKHEYIHQAEAFTSVTTLIKKYFPQFDGRAVATKKAARGGGSVEELLAAWELKRTTAAAFGSRVHLFAETILQANDHAAADALIADARESAFLTSLKSVITRIGKFYEFVEVEKIVFSPRRKLAGTIDLLLRNKETGDYVVADWKTGRKIRREAYGRETGLDCFHELPHCNHVHYSLQLFAYRDLLLSEGYLPPESAVRGILIHLRDEDGRIACDFIEPRDLRTHVTELLKRSLIDPVPREVSI